MGARTDAARAEVLARRGELRGEVDRLEAAARAAVDIPGRVRRAPARTGALAIGTAFIVLGGPKRLYGRARRAIFGPAAELPDAMLPAEIERVLRKLGTDGDQVRGVLEHEFAEYLDSRTEARRTRDLSGTVTEIAGNVLRPVSTRLGRQLAERLFTPDGPGFRDALERVRRRNDGGGR